ncbi:hypothetical protein CN543_22095, partial [Bacillus toyonensis]
LNLSNLGGDTSRLEQGWNHENTFVPFLGMSVFFYPALTVSKTPISKFGRCEGVRWEINCP